MTTTQYLNLKPGDRVHVNYMGLAEFDGTVTAARSHTINHATYLVNVEPDEPVEVNGSLRTGFHVPVAHDGGPALSYNRGEDDGSRVTRI